MATLDSPRKRVPRERERDIVEATRALFDERGVQDAPMDEIARAVGINRALLYRHFGSKEELFVATVVSYLTELAGHLGELDEDGDPAEQLRAACDAYTRFCLEHPAFLDCSLSLMRRPAPALREALSDAIWLRLGQGMAACLGPLARVLSRGAERGVFGVEDAHLTANRLYTQVLGTMHLARVGAGVREAAPGIPQMFVIDPETVRRAAVEDALALARIREP